MKQHKNEPTCHYDIGKKTPAKRQEPPNLCFQVSLTRIICKLRAPGPFRRTAASARLGTRKRFAESAGLAQDRTPYWDCSCCSCFLIVNFLLQINIGYLIFEPYSSNAKDALSRCATLAWCAHLQCRRGSSSMTLRVKEPHFWRSRRHDRVSDKRMFFFFFFFSMIFHTFRSFQDTTGF